MILPRPAAHATFESVLASGATDDAALRASEGLDRLDAVAKTKLTEAEHLRRARIYHDNRSFTEARPHWRPSEADINARFPKLLKTILGFSEQG